MSRRSDPSAAAAQSVRLPSQPIVVRVTASENDRGALRRAGLLARATSRPVVAVYMRDLEYPVLSVSIDGMVTGLEWSTQAVEEDQLVAVARCIAGIRSPECVLAVSHQTWIGLATQAPRKGAARRSRSNDGDVGGNEICFRPVRATLLDASRKSHWAVSNVRVLTG